MRNRGSVNSRPRRSQIPRQESTESRSLNHGWIAALRFRIEHHAIPVKPSRVVEHILARPLIFVRAQQHWPIPLRFRLHEGVDMREGLPAIGAPIHQDVVGFTLHLRQERWPAGRLSGTKRCFTLH